MQQPPEANQQKGPSAQPEKCFWSLDKSGLGREGQEPTYTQTKSRIKQIGQHTASLISFIIQLLPVQELILNYTWLLFDADDTLFDFPRAEANALKKTSEPAPAEKKPEEKK